MMGRSHHKNGRRNDPYKEMQSTCERNAEVRLFNQCCCGKATGITYCELVFLALVNQHVKRMRSII
jgi:hypothetical protein